jgi:hypothetical protein
MNKEILSIALAFGCIAANATSNNYDLLGRKGSKMNSPMVYKNVDYSKTKKNDQQNLGSSLENRSLAKMSSGIKSNAKAIVGKFGPNGYGFSACSKSCVGSGKSGLSVSWGTEKNVLNYLNKANQHFINVVHQEKNRLSPDFNYVTAGPTRSNLSGYTMTETPYNFNVPQSNAYANFNVVNFYVARFIESKTNVGAYVAGNAVPVRLNKENDTYAPFILSDNIPMNNYGRAPDNEMYVSRMFRLMHLFSDQSSVFAAKTRPSNPAGENPQIYVGLHGENVGSSNSWYATKAKDLDNYIYRNRTVEVVAAGNTGKLSPEGYAANAITVGARNIVSDVAASYQEATFTNGASYKKPEIYNYTNFYVNDYKRVYSYPGKQDKTFLPYYEGSESAAAITAGMLSNMLSVNEFYKWHPEVVKAVLVNSLYNPSNSNPLDEPLIYSNLVFNQADSENQHYSYYFIGDVNSLMGDFYNSSPHQQFAYSMDKKKIRLFIMKSLLKDGNITPSGFSIAISWLNSGSDITKRHQLPQIFEIDLYCTDGNGKLTLNTSTTDSQEAKDRNTSYRQTYAYFDQCQNASSLMADIVLDEDYEDAENYGQIVLGVDIQPIR